jgi:hypothetical protein
MKPLEAAQVFYKEGHKSDALRILQTLWETPEKYPDTNSFQVFCALIEIWAQKDLSSAVHFLDVAIAGDDQHQQFWNIRTVEEQALLLDLSGQIHLKLGDAPKAFEQLTRAASLGRDTSLGWRLLGTVCIDNGDLEIGLRYVRRSLQLFRQLDLSLTTDFEDPMGDFTGQHPVNFSHGLEEYLELLLKITKLAKSQKNLRAVRELVVEMIHQFPYEERLPRIRLLMERAIVEASVSLGH